MLLLKYILIQIKIPWAKNQNQKKLQTNNTVPVKIILCKGEETQRTGPQENTVLIKESSLETNVTGMKTERKLPGAVICTPSAARKHVC